VIDATARPPAEAASSILVAWRLVRFLLFVDRMRVVALVSTEPQEELMRYLAGVGFVVRAFRTPLGAPREGMLVWLADPASDDRTVIDTTRGWLGQKAKLRAIVVTNRPARLKQLADDTRGRVLLLAAPVFGWQLVDALRDEALAAS
jgi:hypothetical protein